MAVIEVDHSVLSDVASAVTTYCTAQDREMRTADASIKKMLSSDWTGHDAQEFSAKWEGVDSSGSTAVKFRENLKGWGEALAACAKEYRNAQTEAYNEARRLRWYVW